MQIRCPRQAIHKVCFCGCAGPLWTAQAFCEFVRIDQSYGIDELHDKKGGRKIMARAGQGGLA